jgi:hypothetical protein
MQTRASDPGAFAHFAFRCIVPLAATICLSAIPQPAFARATLLQTVDLNDRGMSTEGGLANLFRLANSGSGHCKIEVVHYGETGQTTYRFIFSSKLNHAARREYRYDNPIYAPHRVRMRLTEEEHLTSRKGKESLPRDFSLYRSMFDPAQIARCSASGKK